MWQVNTSYPCMLPADLGLFSQLTKSLEGILLPMKQWSFDRRSTLPKTALISHINVRHPLKSARNVLEFVTGTTGFDVRLAQDAQT
jgi:hypothetical protein